MLRCFRIAQVSPVLVWLWVMMIASITPIYAQESPDSPVTITAENAHLLRQVAVFGGGRITQPAWSPDGQTIAVAGTQGVWLYDAEDAQKSPILFKLDPGEGRISALAYSPDGVWLATGSATGETRLWSLETGESELILTRKEVGRGRSSVTFSPDGTLLAVGDEATIRLYDMEKRLLQSSLEDVCDGYVASLAFSPDGRMLACGTTSLGDASVGMVGIWDLAARRGLHAVRMDWMWMMTANVAFSPDGESLYVWDSERFFYDDEDYANPAHAPVRQWNISEESYVPLPGWWYESLHFAFVPSDEHVITLDTDGNILFVRDGQTGAVIEQIKGAEYARIDGFARRVNANKVKVAYILQNRLSVWHVDMSETGGASVQTYPRVHSGGILQIAFSGDGRYLASLSPTDRGIEVWDVVTGGVTDFYIEHGTWSIALALNADGSRVVETALASTLSDTDTSEGSTELPLPVHRIANARIFDVAYDHDGAIRVLGCGMVYEDHRPDVTFVSLPGRCDRAYFAKFRRDAQTYIMATSGTDAHVALYGVSPSRLIKRWTDTELITAADLSLSGGLVAVGTGYEAHGGGGIETSLTLLRTDGEPTVLVTPQDTYSCVSFLSIVRGLAFSPDDRLLAVASGDSQANGLIVEIWDVHNAVPLVTLEGHTDIILDVAFSPDGSMLATAGRDGMIRLWVVGDTPVTRDAPECPPSGQG